MTQLYSEIPKFKRIELLLRKTSSGYRDILDEIDRALEKKRTNKEIALLNSIRQECVELYKQSKNAILHLNEGLDHDDKK